MEPTHEPESHARDEGRRIRIGGDLLLVKALTGMGDGVAVLETVAAPASPRRLTTSTGPTTRCFMSSRVSSSFVSGTA
jgi:hypothetical protein